MSKLNDISIILQNNNILDNNQTSINLLNNIQQTIYNNL